MASDLRGPTTVNAVTEQGGRNSVDVLTGVDASSTVAAIRGVISNPAANTTLSALVLACAVAAIMVLALLVLALATPARKKVVKVRRYRGVRPDGMEDGQIRHVAPPPVARQIGPLARLLLSSGFLVALAVVAVVGGYLSTSSDKYCAESCHAGTVAVRTAMKAEHARCSSCHEVGGLWGAPANVVSRVRMLVAFTLWSDPASALSPTDSGECLRCHREIADRLSETRDGLRMSHAEVIEAALPCASCHVRSGHVTLRSTVPMSKCLPCHDAKVASAECTTCHKQTPSSTVVVTGGSGDLGGADYVYPAVRAAKRKCGGCHNERRECDQCHGIRMPHSRAFREGGHSPAAAFEAKLKCWKCHDPQWCSNGGCHSAVFYAETGDTTHGSGWKQEHKRAAWDAGCVCHQGRSNRAYPICDRCHAKDRSVLPITP